jgi:hypothetical protein
MLNRRHIIKSVVAPLVALFTASFARAVPFLREKDSLVFRGELSSVFDRDGWEVTVQKVTATKDFQSWIITAPCADSYNGMVRASVWGSREHVEKLARVCVVDICGDWPWLRMPDGSSLMDCEPNTGPSISNEERK